MAENQHYDAPGRDYTGKANVLHAYFSPQPELHTDSGAALSSALCCFRLSDYGLQTVGAVVQDGIYQCSKGITVEESIDKTF